MLPDYPDCLGHGHKEFAAQGEVAELKCGKEVQQDADL